MKYLLLLTLALVLVGCGRQGDRADAIAKTNAPSAKSADEALPAGMIRLKNVDLRQVLSLYEALSGRPLLMSCTNSLPAGSISYANDHPLSRGEALTQLAEALRRQAGLVISPLDSTHDLLTREPAAAKP